MLSFLVSWKRAAPLAAAALVALGTAANARAAPVGFGVSAPADPVTATPGKPLETWLGVWNNLERPAVLTIRLVTLRADDEGRLRVLDRPDPLWAKRVEVQERVELPPNGSKQVPVRLRVPERALPDLYLVGFLVEPPAAVRPGEVTVRSQIATFLLVDIPGPRNRSLEILWHDVPRFSIGGRLSGRYRIQGKGDAAVLFRAQAWIDRRDGTNLGIVRSTGDRRVLLPPRTYRTLSYEWPADGWWLLARPRIEISYSRGAAGMATIVESGPLALVLPWKTIVLALVVLALLIVVVWRARRRQRQEPAPTASRLARFRRRDAEV